LQIGRLYAIIGLIEVEGSQLAVIYNPLQEVDERVSGFTKTFFRENKGAIESIKRNYDEETYGYLVEEGNHVFAYEYGDLGIENGFNIVNLREGWNHKEDLEDGKRYKISIEGD